jgi:spore maturation protein CgeB
MRHEGRPVVDAALAAGLHVTAFGPGWEGYHENLTFGGGYVDNQKVGDLYRSAGAVLNDHWDDMRMEGFISNRLYDACACAVPVISDHVPGMKRIFGEAVSTLGDGDVRALYQRIDDGRKESRSMRLEVAQHIAEKHSFAMRATEILAAVGRRTAPP